MGRAALIKAEGLLIERAQDYRDRAAHGTTYDLLDREDADLEWVLVGMLRDR